MNLIALRKRLVDESTHRCRGHLCLAGSLAILGLVCSTLPLHADGTNLVNTEQSELKKLSLEELMNLEVTSVSKKSEKLSQSAAAIYVITQEDIRRSGVTTIPEALRMAPGLDVARVDAHSWAISARGFNNVFANKLLVLIDGRSVYTPLFSGVFWDIQDVMLEDIDRIEVIRGPGAALWGANAVNGVINIITKSAKDTQGTLVTAGGGTEEKVFGGARYGGQIGSNTYARVYAKYFNRDNSILPNGHVADDHWYGGRGGFRLDSTEWTDNLFTLQGDAYAGLIDDSFTEPTLTAPFSRLARDPADLSGGNILGRWTHTFTSESETVLQTYYDRAERDADIFEEKRDTFDIDFQHRFQLLSRQQIVWGLGYRLSHDQIGNSFNISFDPTHRSTQLLSAFVQDEITLIKDRLRLTLGSKFEHNDFTGFEVQPSGRLLWTPAEHHSVWAGVSRAVRTPSRAEEDVRINQQVIPGAPPTVASLMGDHSMDSEKLIAYEIGYRVEPVHWFSFDVAAFYNVYDDLRTIEPGTPFLEVTPAPPHGVAPYSPANKMHGEAYGVEVDTRWQVFDWWHLHANYTFLDLQLHLDKSSGDTFSVPTEGNSPQHQFGLRSSMDLPWHLEFDAGVRYVDSLPGLNIPSYVTVDLRLGWKPTKNLELSIIGQNLLDGSHHEFAPSFINSQKTEVQRSVYGKVTWHY